MSKVVFDEKERQRFFHNLKMGKKKRKVASQQVHERKVKISKRRRKKIKNEAVRKITMELQKKMDLNVPEILPPPKTTEYTEVPNPDIDSMEVTIQPLVLAKDREHDLILTELELHKERLRLGNTNYNEEKMNMKKEIPRHLMNVPGIKSLSEKTIKAIDSGRIRRKYGKGSFVKGKANTKKRKKFLRKRKRSGGPRNKRPMKRRKR